MVIRPVGYEGAMKQGDIFQSRDFNGKVHKWKVGHKKFIPIRSSHRAKSHVRRVG